MTKDTMLKIGLDLNAIGMMVCDECHEKIKDRLKHIEELIMEEHKKGDFYKSERYRNIAREQEFIDNGRHY